MAFNCGLSRVNEQQRAVHLLVLPVDEVPVVGQDGPAPLPELQEDCRWGKKQTDFSMMQAVKYDCYGCNTMFYMIKKINLFKLRNKKIHAELLITWVC